MANLPPYRLRLFILRLWQEVLNGDVWEWRGEVKNTSSGEVRYFRDFRVLVDLLPGLLAESLTHDEEQPGYRQPFPIQQERKMNTTTQTLETGIDATNRVFEAAFARGDAAGAVSVYSESAQAFPPNSPMISGRAALQKFWQGVMDMGVKKVTLETVELQPLGDQAYEVGKATLYVDGGGVADAVKFIVVWQQENGQWKWHRDIWNSNNPA